MSRRIGVFSSTRADAWPLGPVLTAIHRSADLELLVLVAGTHTEERRGRTLSDLAEYPHVVVDAHIEGDRPEQLVRSAGRLTECLASVFAADPIDLLIVLGDRWELLSPVLAALMFGVPIAHLHGGEVTEGSSDERIRHAVTKLADIHLCATHEYGTRIRQLGEESWRIHVTGSPSLDRFSGVVPVDLASLSGHLSVPLTHPLGLVTYHPATTGPRDVGPRSRIVFDAAARHLASVIVTYPGADEGSEAIIEELHHAERNHANLHVFPSLGARYASLLASADVLIGNSSSGIIEAPTFRLPVVNVGDRQRGRIMPENVVHAVETPESLDTAITHALSPEFRQSLQDLVNPYGDGQAAPRIVKIVSEVPLEPLRRKRFVDLRNLS